MSPRPLAFALALLLALPTSGPAQAGDFGFGFTWAGLKSCTSGSPNRVPNPAFTVQNVPAGTRFIEFRMTDLDVPGYNHGGGTVAWSGEKTIAPGAFSYASPCPPNGSHRYRWTATAKSKRMGGVLARATAVRRYPE